ncbi:GTP-binding protein [Actinoplanes sp. NPDC051851]|uniref:GTP-binding protein n=1 Tax=Actinoplanes sp. NPDC051851 TaxID=3154753 RepID=UPI0034432496
MSEAPKPAVTVLSGFSRDAVQATARALLIADENLIAISHDLTDIRHGRVTRTVRSLSELLEHSALPADAPPFPPRPSPMSPSPLSSSLSSSSLSSSSLSPSSSPADAPQRGRAGPEWAATLERVTVELVHGCVSCTLREDVLPTLVRLARTYPGRDLLLVLPPAIEPETVAAACARCTVGGEPLAEIVHFDSYVTVVDADRFLGDLTSSDDLRDRNLHTTGDDHRSVADVVTHQVEFSDTIVLWSRPGTDPSALDHLGTLLHRLAPWSVLVPTGTTHRIACTGLSTLTRHTARHDPSRPGILARTALGSTTLGVAALGPAAAGVTAPITTST